MEHAVLRISHNAAAVKQISAAGTLRLSGRRDVSAGRLVGVAAEAQGAGVKIVVAVAENVVGISLDPAVFKIPLCAFMGVERILAAQEFTVKEFCLVRVDQHRRRPLSGLPAADIRPQRSLKIDVALAAVGQAGAVRQFLLRHIVVEGILERDFLRLETAGILGEAHGSAPAGRLCLLVFVVGSGGVVESILAHAVILVADSVIPGDDHIPLLRQVVDKGDVRHIHRHLLPVHTGVNVHGNPGLGIGQAHRPGCLHGLPNGPIAASGRVTHVQIRLKGDGRRCPGERDVEIPRCLRSHHRHMGGGLIQPVRRSHGRLVDAVSQRNSIGLPASIRRRLYSGRIALPLISVRLHLREGEGGHICLRRQMEQTAAHRVEGLLHHCHLMGEGSLPCGRDLPTDSDLVVVQASEHGGVGGVHVQNAGKMQLSPRLSGGKLHHRRGLEFIVRHKDQTGLGPIRPRLEAGDGSLHSHSGFFHDFQVGRHRIAVHPHREAVLKSIPQHVGEHRLIGSLRQGRLVAEAILLREDGRLVGDAAASRLHWNEIQVKIVIGKAIWDGNGSRHQASRILHRAVEHQLGVLRPICLHRQSVGTALRHQEGVGRRLAGEGSPGDHSRLRLPVGKAEDTCHPVGGLHIEGHLGPRRQLVQGDGAPAAVGVVGAGEGFSVHLRLQPVLFQGSEAVDPAAVIHPVIVPGVDGQGADGDLSVLEDVFSRVGSALHEVLLMAVPESPADMADSALHGGAAHIPDLCVRRHVHRLRAEFDLLEIGSSSSEINGYVLQGIAVADIDIVRVAASLGSEGCPVRLNHSIPRGVGADHQFALSLRGHIDPGARADLGIGIIRSGRAFSLSGVNVQVIEILAAPLQIPVKRSRRAVEQPHPHASIWILQRASVADGDGADVVLGSGHPNGHPPVLLGRIILQHSDSGPVVGVCSSHRVGRSAHFQDRAFIGGDQDGCLHPALHRHVDRPLTHQVGSSEG